MGIIIVVGLIGIFFVIVNCKIYQKLEIDEKIIRVYLIITIASVVSIFIHNQAITTIINLAMAIISIILIVLEYKAIGFNPWLLLLCLIPVAGLVVVIIAACKLADYFGKGTGFKLGLIFLPFIFRPILAFSDKE